MAIIFIRLLAVFLMIAMGAVARRRGFLDSGGTRQVSRIVTNILYPALVYSSLVRAFTLRELAANWMLPAGSLLIMGCGFLVGLAAAHRLPCDDGRKRAFRFQCTINNYVFLPMPLVMMYWGNDGVALLVLTTVGSELAVWTLGVVALTGHKVGWGSLRHLLSMPMAAIAAATLTLSVGHFLPWTPAAESHLGQLTGAVLSVLGILGGGTVPLAMMVAGSRMTELKLTHLLEPTQMVLVALRLVVVPAAAVGLLWLLPFDPDARRVLVVVAVMPSAIASVMLSDIYNADSEFAATSVLITHIVSLFTIPAWLAIAS